MRNQVIQAPQAPTQEDLEFFYKLSTLNIHEQLNAVNQLVKATSPFCKERIVIEEIKATLASCITFVGLGFDGSKGILKLLKSL